MMFLISLAPMMAICIAPSNNPSHFKKINLQNRSKIHLNG